MRHFLTFHEVSGAPSDRWMGERLFAGSRIALPSRTPIMEATMPKYLLEVNYTLDGVRGLLTQGGSARQAAAQAAAESVGGTVESFLFAFGGTDVYVVADLPDNAAAAALSLAVTAAGGVTAKTVVLLTPAEIDAAVAKQVSYRPPGS
jgi:uncharacterized protein with GYD domain